MMTTEGTKAKPIKIPTKVLKSGFVIPAYALGTWRFGGGQERDPKNDDHSDIQSIRETIDHGVTAIDTAEIYAGGHTEELVASAISGLDRAKLFISSKVMNPGLRYDEVLQACERSLARVGTGYFDMYMLHRSAPKEELAEQLRAMSALCERGIIRAIGVSNFSTKSLMQAQAMANNKIVYNQVHYNLCIREPEKDGLLTYCQENDVILAAWRPFQRGYLLQKEVPLLQEIAEKYNKTAHQIAINWLVSQKNVVTIAKTSKIEHLEENLGGLNWQMDAADIELLRSQYPEQKEVSDSVPLG